MKGKSCPSRCSRSASRGRQRCAERLQPLPRADKEKAADGRRKARSHEYAHDVHEVAAGFAVAGSLAGCWSRRRPARAAGGAAGQLGSVLKKAQQVHDLRDHRRGRAEARRSRQRADPQRYGVVQDPAVHKYVDAGRRRARAGAASGRSLPWNFIVLDTDGVNAFAAPGGYVHITRGALSLMKNEAELAGVLGHEIIHVTEKHTIRAIQKGKAVQMGADETLGATSPALFSKLVDKATEIVMAGLRPRRGARGRREGRRARQQGRLRRRTGSRTFLTTLTDRNKDSTEKQGLFASHPEMDERLEKLDKTLPTRS